MSCGTAPSCQHWQRTPCSGSSKVVLQCLIRLRGDQVNGYENIDSNTK